MRILVVFPGSMFMNHYDLFSIITLYGGNSKRCLSKAKEDEKQKEGKSRPGSNQACFKGISVSLKLYNIGCLGAFGRVDNVELHLLAFGQRLKTAVLNVAEMNKYIAALFTGYESKPFGIIEPLY